MKDVTVQKKDELESCFEFILELEKLKAVQRRTKPLGLERYENSAEHSWQVSLLALTLAKFANQPIDIERVIKMLLLHDIGEIDADDTFFFNSTGRQEAKGKEAAGVKRLLAILPDEKADEFWKLWNEFENGDSNEAKYARAIDRVMPMLQNLYNNKQSWTEHSITKEQILSKTAYIGDGSKIIWERIAEKVNQVFE
ncbi:MAG TPA: HD domain-containing protein [Pyrinomonadaceae bacterium]|nr:HD domain-containing protein [Pyrinomonadaceae bacterium]